MKQKWSQSGKSWNLTNENKQHSKLKNEVYVLKCDAYQSHYWLDSFSEEFHFDYKIYGLESTLISRICKTYEEKKGNLGILFNGLKGTGKSVTSEILCNKFKQPTIIITQQISREGILFLSSIPQSVTIFVDEYEKIFNNSNSLLTIMDGVLSSVHKRAFIFTTNTLAVNEFLLERPSRIRYLKTFGNLGAEVIEEIIDDRLKNKEFKNDTLVFLLSLRTITMDIVISTIEEINIHNQSPLEFESIFNVKRIKNVNTTGELTEILKTNDFVKAGAPVSNEDEEWEKEDEEISLDDDVKCMDEIS